MLRAPSPRRVRVAALVALVLLLVLSGSEVMKWDGRPYQLDFKVYLTAAKLVREHKSLDIYNNADTGQNPQTRYAAKDSRFQAAATELGIPAIWLYVYPPTLADLLVPFTYLSLQHACDAWLAVNVLTVVFSAMLLSWLMFDSVLGLTSVGIFVGMLCFRSNIWGFEQGQICCVLMLLWVAGIVFYLKGYKRTSAALFALATAIKLTPLLVLLPMLIWREWKWARWYGIGLFVLLIGLLGVNGFATLADYVQHVMPPMSTGFLSLANISIPSGLQQFYEGLTGGAFQGEHVMAPAAVALSTKAVAAIVLLAAMGFIYRLGPVRSAIERAKILSMVALLSLYCSPVAWRSAYGVVFLTAFFLWKDAFEFGASKTELLLLVLCTLEFSFFFDTILIRFTHGVLLSTTALIAPVLGCVLIFYTLWKMQRSQTVLAVV